MQKRIKIVVDSKLRVKVRDLKELGPEVLVTTKQLFTYKNPTFLENQKWGYSNHDTPKHLYTYAMKDGIMSIARGGLEKLEKHLKKFGAKIAVIDRTYVGPHVSFEQSNITLRPDQEKFNRELLKHTNGLGQGYTSFGKTVSCCEIIKEVGQKTLIMVHTTFLQKQWIEELTKHELFNLNPEHIGGVGGIFNDKKEFVSTLKDESLWKTSCVGKVNVCLYQSLDNKKHFEKFKDCGLIIFDEGQKSPIEKIQMQVNKFRARFKYAVSAGFKRKDGKEFLTFDTFGPIRTVAIEKNAKSKIISDILVVKTGYKDPEYDGDYTSMLNRMAKAKQRNIFICKRAIKAVQRGEMVMIFVERKEHAAILFKMLSKFKVDMLIGGVNKKAIRESKTLSPAVKKILLNYDDTKAFDRIKRLANKKKLQIIIGSQKAEVGLSIRPVDRGIVSAMVANNEERFNQIKGRIERTYSDEQEEYFGGKKGKPVLEVLEDKIPNSRNGVENIKEVYGNRVRRLRTKKTILRKKGARK